MKYQNLLSFQKHLEQAAKVELSHVFLIIAACPYERRKIADKIVAAIETLKGQVDLQIKEGGDVRGLIDGLNTASLLSLKPVLYFDAIDKLKKNGMELLTNYIKKPSPFAYLILGASGVKGLGDLYAQSKKELIVCDLSDEKPWDRKDRLKRSLLSYVEMEGKKIHADALDYLLENVGLNLAQLESEVAKMITYAGLRKEVTLQDANLLCAAQKNSTLWQLAEAIIWKEGVVKTEEMLDLSTLLPLIASLRTQLQHGMTIASLLEKGTSSADISSHCPTLKPAQLNKMLILAKQRQSSFFKRALAVLFDVELLAKNSSFDPCLILDLFVTKITLLKKHHALSFSKSSI